MYVFEDLLGSHDESFLLKRKKEMIFFLFSVGIIHIGQAYRDQLGLPSRGTVQLPSSMAPGSSGPGADPKPTLRRGLLIKKQVTSHKKSKGHR